MEQQANRKSMRDAAEPAQDDQPITTATYLALDVTSVDGRRKFKGRFKYKVPTMGDRVDIGAMKARYCQELQLDRSADNIAEAIAYLAITLDPKEVPDWWITSKGGIDLHDFTPVLALYAKARAYEATFLGGRSDIGGDADEGEVGPGDDAEGDVGGDIQDPPERSEVLAEFGKGAG